MSSNEYVTRVATPSDFAAVDALLRASYPTLMASAYEPAVLAPALELMARANPRLLACGTYYIAVSGELVVGCGGWTREYPGRQDVQHELAHLRHFGTHPQWTQRGIGRAIYALAKRRHALRVCAHSNARRASMASRSTRHSGFWSCTGSKRR